MNIVSSLKILPKANYEVEVGKHNEPILNSINKFRNHPSIKLIKSEKKGKLLLPIMLLMKKFLIKSSTCKTYKLQKNPTQQNDVPTKILKENSEVFSQYFHENITFYIENLVFPSDLKLANVSSAFKKKPKTSKGNYRPISILPNISKIYERYLYNQIQTFFDEILSKCHC